MAKKEEAMVSLHARVKKSKHKVMLRKLVALHKKNDPRATESDIVRIAIEEKFYRDIK